MQLEELKLIEETAKMPGLSMEEIANVVGYTLNEFASLMANQNDVYEAYHKGRLLAQVEINMAVVKLSNSGSGPAQSLLIKMKENADYQSLLQFYD